ncbi:MAG: sulfotransferase domain-containing protein [Bacteroidales bacterium]
MYREPYNTIAHKLRGKLFFGSLNRVDLIIIGAQKCGTTALFEFLTTHPKLIGSKQKEINFFNNDKKYIKGIDFYHGFFPKRKNGLIYFEASPSYLQDNNCISCERIYEYNSKIKMIIMLRNPIERAFSAYNMYCKKWRLNEYWFDSWKIPNRQYIQRDYKDYSSFNYFIKHELDAINDHNSIEAPIISSGKYIDSIEKYYNKFGSEQFHFIENSRLLSQTHYELNKVIDFLDIEEKINWNFPSGMKIFEGNYENGIDKETYQILSSFYKPYNTKLFNLLNMEYEW